MKKLLTILFTAMISLTVIFCDGGGGSSDGGTGATTSNNCSTGLTERTSSAGWVGFDSTTTISTSAGVNSPTIKAQIYISGVTDISSSESDKITAQIGYGPQGSDPNSSQWCWYEASYIGTATVPNNDQYGAALKIDTAGTYSFTVRFKYSGDSDSGWELATTDGTFPYSTTKFGTITVNP